MTIVKVNKVRLYPNAEMKQVLDENCDYRRFCWNKGLETWNAMYKASLTSDDTPKPGRYNVCNALVAVKEDWQYELSSRVLQQAIADLDKTWKDFFNKVQSKQGKPKFKSKKSATSKL
jgi:transposase